MATENKTPNDELENELTSYVNKCKDAKFKDITPKEILSYCTAISMTRESFGDDEKFEKGINLLLKSLTHEDVEKETVCLVLAYLTQMFSDASKEIHKTEE